MSQRIFTIDVHDEGKDGLWAEVVELPGCFASGFTVKELYESLEEAIGLYLSEPGHEMRARLAGVEHTDDTVQERRKFNLAVA